MNHMVVAALEAECFQENYSQEASFDLADLAHMATIQDAAHGQEASYQVQLDVVVPYLRNPVPQDFAVMSAVTTPLSRDHLMYLRP
jgi:hypothetical protein